MSITNDTENSILNLVFSATAWANVADNAAGTPITNIHVALQTADPGEAGTMQTSEAAYTNYGRVNVLRSTGWTTSTVGSVNPAANIDFPSSGAAGTTVTHFSVGKTGGGTAQAFWNGTVAPPIAIGAAGITPRLTVATAITLD